MKPIKYYPVSMKISTIVSSYYNHILMKFQKFELVWHKIILPVKLFSFFTGINSPILNLILSPETIKITEQGIVTYLSYEFE